MQNSGNIHYQLDQNLCFSATRANTYKPHQLLTRWKISMSSTQMQRNLTTSETDWLSSILNEFLINKQKILWYLVAVMLPKWFQTHLKLHVCTGLKTLNINLNLVEGLKPFLYYCYPHLTSQINWGYICCTEQEKPTCIYNSVNKMHPQQYTRENVLQTQMTKLFFKDFVGLDTCNIIFCKELKPQNCRN